MEKVKKPLKQDTLIAKACHVCGHYQEAVVEPERCVKCAKAFLPLNYFHKIHAHKGEKFQALFAEGEQLDDADLIKGLYVLW